MRDPLRRSQIRRLTLAQLAVFLQDTSTIDHALLRALARDPRHGVRAFARRLRVRMNRLEHERRRIEALYAIERDHRARGFAIIAGVDQAGVAPLAGPVVAAAVILPELADLPGLDDSKRLDPTERAVLYQRVRETAVAISTGVATVDEIDRLNILQATRLAHRRAVAALRVRPYLVMIDGRIPADLAVPQLVIIDGDATCASIAAASIVAKVTRDQMMRQFGERYPGYGFAGHKGYGTKAHYEAIGRLGASPIHRRSFVPVRGQQELLPIG
ncbi:MAG: ribonuclease HII [Armatimonadetes bacterium]|nr:ribonuclease HII [Armatimonadota bacterium]